MCQQLQTMLWEISRPFQYQRQDPDVFLSRRTNICPDLVTLELVLNHIRTGSIHCTNRPVELIVGRIKAFIQGTALCDNTLELCMQGLD